MLESKLGDRSRHLAFFDSVPHDLVLGAVRRHTDERWILLYVERWLQAPLQQENGTLVPRDRGTPQGSAISPLLANLFLHYAFDVWMEKRFPYLHFERYCDDAVVHCKTEKQAQFVRAAIARRLAQCGLELHPDKTRVVYCKDENRSGRYANERFDFLGYTFRPRRAKTKTGKLFVGFLPAVSDDAMKEMGRELRGWRLNCRSDKSLDDYRGRSADRGRSDWHVVRPRAFWRCSRHHHDLQEPRRRHSAVWCHHYACNC